WRTPRALSCEPLPLAFATADSLALLTRGSAIRAQPKKCTARKEIPTERLTSPAALGGQDTLQKPATRTTTRTWSQEVFRLTSGLAVWLLNVTRVRVNGTAKIGPWPNSKLRQNQRWHKMLALFKIAPEPTSTCAPAYHLLATTPRRTDCPLVCQRCRNCRQRSAFVGSRQSVAGLPIICFDVPISDLSRKRQRQLAHDDLRFPSYRCARRGPRGGVGRFRHPGQGLRKRRVS